MSIPGCSLVLIVYIEFEAMNNFKCFEHVFSRLERELDFGSSLLPSATALPAAEQCGTFYGSVDGSLYTSEELLAAADAPPASPTNGLWHPGKTPRGPAAAGCGCHFHVTHISIQLPCMLPTLQTVAVSLSLRSWLQDAPFAMTVVWIGSDALFCCTLCCLGWLCRQVQEYLHLYVSV